ncbi:hypothetical protein [Homoserinimonas sp. OAct 916]|uniref:DUF6993 domain-containing protein n=1 Tax=Homoserinimonas sp. OAct 916 TaxID=2211450 RepID=UPI001E64AEDA|nr:hypothetical protein [Homoserinimonas sp. OAct 916]
MRLKHQRFATGVLGAAALAGALTVGLAACTTAPDAPATSAGTSAKPAPGLPTLEPGPPPEFTPEGTAPENLPFFDYTNIMVILGGDDIGGRDIIDGLAAAGFDKSQMEVSRDVTPTGLRADSIQFSVMFHDECLIGQWGAGTGYHSMVAAPLATDQCLVGATRPIDW